MLIKRRHFKHIKLGEKFNRWTVLGRLPKSRMVCLCSCGREGIVSSGNLRSSKSQSCGCLKLERLSQRATHGACQVEGYTPEYRSWCHIVDRCCNPKAPAFHRYGGRGILICPEWRASFEAFRDHIGPRPSSSHSVERIENNKGYEPGNVKWPLPREQSRNTSRNHLMTLNGETMCLTDWASRIGLGVGTLWARTKAGWTDERALLTPYQGMGGRRY